MVCNKCRCNKQFSRSDPSLKEMRRFGPDSKQSWLVLVACFIVKFLSFGLVEVAGMLMIATMHRFETTREAASLPYTLIYTIRNGSGPLIAYISNIIGIRSATLLGCALSSIAVGACFFAESVLTITILWGILFGFGFAFESLLVNAIICEHFEKHVSKAIGIVSLGAGSGVIFFAPFLDMLVNNFGLSAAFLLIAGVILHTIPAAIYVILNPPTECDLIKNVVHVSNDNCKFSLNCEHHSSRNDLNTTKDTSVVLTRYCRKICIFSKHTDSEEDVNIQTIHSINFKISSINSNLQVKTSTNEKPNMHYKENICSKSKKCTKASMQSKSINQSVNDFLCETIEPSASFKTNDFESGQKVSPQANFGAKNLQPLQLMKTLFCNQIFWMILICNGMFYFIYPAFFTLLPDYAIDQGINTIYSKYILIYLTLCSFSGCLILGFVADMELVSNGTFACLCFLTESLALILIIWANNVILLALCVFVFQFTMPGLLIIYPSVIADSLTRELQSSAIASLYILSAPLNLTVSPLIGYFRDERGSYAGVYLTLAGAAFVGCLSQMCALKCVKRQNQTCK